MDIMQCVGMRGLAEQLGTSSILVKVVYMLVGLLAGEVLLVKFVTHALVKRLVIT